MSQKPKSHESSDQRGKLRIGNDWNAITIIALSQSNPLKAIAELVENSIDARATNVTIIRGRSEGRHYLEVRDNGQGIPRDTSGRPDFRYVATHICDSVKRRLKVEGAAGLQGEFGIGLLSFWTLGEELTLTSIGADDRAWQMVQYTGAWSTTWNNPISACASVMIQGAINRKMLERAIANQQGRPTGSTAATNPSPSVSAGSPNARRTGGRKQLRKRNRSN